MLKLNLTRKDDAIAFENVKYILNVHGAAFKEIKASSTPRLTGDEIHELRKQFPELGARGLYDKVLEKRGTLGLIFVTQHGDCLIYLPESEVERLRMNRERSLFKGDYVRNVLHAAYCGCSGCGSRMNVCSEMR